MPYYNTALNKDTKEYNEGVAETEAARKDASLFTLELEYMVHFKKYPCLKDYIEGPHLESAAYLHGGKVAVLKEAIRSNISCPELLGYNVPSNYGDIPKDDMQLIFSFLQEIKSGQRSLGTQNT